MHFRLGVFPVAVLGVALLVGVPAARSQDAHKKTVAITVLVPQEDADLYFDDSHMKQSGKIRFYTTPPLDDRYGYDYTLKVVWEPNNYTKITRTQVVKLNPSKFNKLEVDMTKPDPRWKDDIVVRYVPTPPDIVDAMCKLAKVGRNDVVYDLGCGDGRMVIRAVANFGAKRGVGIDLNPQLLEESRTNATKAKVETKVEFRLGDVLKIDDIPDASVVLLYMGNDINLRLKPILQAKLKPGSRVVSHRFTMGDWQPTTTQTVRGQDGGMYEIHLWVIGEKK